VKKMIMPAASKKDLIDIPKKIKNDMEFIFVEEIGEVFDHAMTNAAKKKVQASKPSPKKRKK
jgi:ATP-dependent Lon protease